MKYVDVMCTSPVKSTGEPLAALIASNFSSYSLLILWADHFDEAPWEREWEWFSRFFLIILEFDSEDKLTTYLTVDRLMHKRIEWICIERQPLLKLHEQNGWEVDSKNVI